MNQLHLIQFGVIVTTDMLFNSHLELKALVTLSVGLTIRIMETHLSLLNKLARQWELSFAFYEYYHQKKQASKFFNYGLQTTEIC
jgi:hypothetical protein